jgi:hypothetical protein
VKDLEMMWEIFKNFPLEVHLLLAAPLLVTGVLFWAINRSRTIDHRWYDYWIKHINTEVRYVRMRVKRKDREQAYRYVFGQLWNELHTQIGTDYSQMTTMQRGIFIILAETHRNHMRGYE